MSTFRLSTWLFLRLLALVHLVAFASFWVQLEGLVGPHGLLPATRYFAAAREAWGAAAYLNLPSLCWLFGTETFLHVLCGGGVALALLALAGVAQGPCFALLWAAYLSLNAAGQIFFNFQWDTLLLETTLCALFVAPWSWRTRGAPVPSRVGVWLLRWLLFRLMFLAGVVKLASGDPLWRSLTALTVHFETQPLPTPLAWHAHQAPPWWQRAECSGMFAIELLAPLLLFAPRALRHNATLLLAALMAAIALTGNYTFFNLLAIALCLTQLDDAWWRRVLPARLAARLAPAAPETAPARRTVRGLLAWVAAGCMLAFTGVRVVNLLAPQLGEPPGFRAAAALVEPFRSLNTYGLFAVMTPTRPELIFEGSEDGREWRAYEFPHKPGALDRAPTWVAPHQPRLDWQLWFAALGSPQQNPWVLALCEHLLRGTPAVLGRLEKNPFPEKPPQQIRVLRYEYHFTDRATRARTGDWWRRTLRDVYVPPAALR
jgi:hypothetical protein